MNKNEYKELKSSISKVENSVEGFKALFGQMMEFVADKFSGLETRFSTLLDHVVAMRVDIDDIKENKANKADVDRFYNAVDAHAQKAKTYFQEHEILGGQVSRHQKWIEKIAKEIDTKLDY